MASSLVFGFLIGLRHALDIDHVAAILTFAASENASPGRSMALGGIWGIGHATMLLLMGMATLLFGLQPSANLALVIEFAVGVMLVVLALDVFRRLGRFIIHKHTHHHVNGNAHMHFHAHLRNGSHEYGIHNHSHPDSLLCRALLVGFMHGMAGTAILMFVVMQTATSIEMGFVTIVLFGLGSMSGMVVLSLAIAFPMRRTRYFSAGLNRFVRGAAALVTLIVGIVLMMKTGGDAGFYPFGSFHLLPPIL